MRLLPNRPIWWQRCCQLWCLLALALATGASLADTPVSGTIGSNTTWRAAQSPYLLQGSVVLDNNAILVIEPGVEVRMGAGASFTVKHGAVQALGSANSPIIITSQAANPAPGDWGQWRFTADTLSAQTLLDNVRIAYGSGVVIEGAAPVLNNVAIQQHSGPAISVDLAASPVGRNLSASGNALNGIAVPSGAIRGQVVWGLVGIPYVVQSGLVKVGQTPLTLEPDRLRLSPGVVAVLRLSTNTQVQAGGMNVDLISSVPSVASVAARATLPEGQTSVDVEVQTHAVGATTVTASQSSLGTAATLVEVVDLPRLEIAPSAPTVGLLHPYAMQLNLPQPAPAGGLPVALNNAAPTVVRVPASLFVPGGQQSLNFEVTGLAEGVSRISVQAEGFATGLATVTVRSKALALPGNVLVAPGIQAPVTVDLTDPAPAGGLTVSLRTDADSIATVPGTVSVPAGASQAVFNVSGLAQGTTTLQASAAGYQSAQATVRVDAIALDTDPSGSLALNVEQSLTRRVILSKTAPPGGVTVKVAAATPGLVTVSPAQVLVPEGQIYGLAPVTVTGVAVGSTTLDLSVPGLIGKSVPITVKEKIGLAFYRAGGQSKVVVGKAMASDSRELVVRRLVSGTVSGGTDSVKVNLRCVDASVCSVPTTVTIPAGGSEASVRVTGLEIGSTRIEATADGAIATTPMPVEVIAPTINMVGLDGSRTTASARDDFYVTLDVPGVTYPQYPASVLTVNLGLPQQMPAGIVGGIYSSYAGGAPINQTTIDGSRARSDWVYIAQPSKAGTYRVSADIPGVASGQSAIQSVVAVNKGLLFYYRDGDQSKVVVGKALKTQGMTLTVQRLINGAASNGELVDTVNLRCVDASVCSVPATVAIFDYSTEAIVPVTGLTIGSTQIEATAEGFTAAKPIPVEVVAPTLSISGLDDNRTTVSLRDGFYVGLHVPGVYYGQYPASNLTVNLGLTNQMPEGVVNGIYDDYIGGKQIIQVIINTNGDSSNSMYVSQPARAGTYRVSADIPGVASVQSATQSVVAANQGLSLYRYGGGSKVVVGKAMTSPAEFVVRRLVNGKVSAGADSVVVSLHCVDASVCSVPATVTIPAGRTEIEVPVTGLAVGSTQIEASAAGFDSAVINMETVTPQLMVLSNLPTSMKVGQQYPYVSFFAQAPGVSYSQTTAQPITLTLTSSVPSVATVSSSVNWASGNNMSGYGTVTAVAPGTTRITASAPGFVPVITGDITVNP